MRGFKRPNLLFNVLVKSITTGSCLRTSDLDWTYFKEPVESQNLFSLTLTFIRPEHGTERGVKSGKVVQNKDDVRTTYCRKQQKT